MFGQAADDAARFGDPLPAPAAFAVSPATKVDVSIKKCDAAEQIVYGEVYAPDVPDSQGDFMTVETIKAMAHGFMRKGLLAKVDVNHSQVESGCYIVESFLARDDDPVFIPQAWVVGVKIPDPLLWAQVEKGELNGFSLDGFAAKVETVIELEIPDLIRGATDEVNGHAHTFAVEYDAEGNFLGGVTDPGPDGHVHKISTGTITDVANGHSHRFSFVEGIIVAQVAA